MLGRPYPIFNYLTFTVAIHKVSGQDSSEVKSYIFRKKKCMIIFCCAPIFKFQHGAWIYLYLLELFLNILVIYLKGQRQYTGKQYSICLLICVIKLELRSGFWIERWLGIAYFYFKNSLLNLEVFQRIVLTDAKYIESKFRFMILMSNWDLIILC